MIFGIGGKNLSRITFVPLNFKPCDCIVTYVTINIIKIIKQIHVFFSETFFQSPCLPRTKAHCCSQTIEFLSQLFVIIVHKALTPENQTPAGPQSCPFL